MRFASAQAIRHAGLHGLCQSLDDAGLRYQRRSLQPVLDWAEQAANPDAATNVRRRFALALDDDRLQKAREIQAVERVIAAAGRR